jgi:type VI secretion system protein ImpA
MSEPLLDLERLLAPISDESPTGEELSLSDLSGPLLRIKDAFDEARRLVKEEQDRDLNGGVDSFGQAWRRIPPPDWDAVIELSTTTLSEVSKDFRIASWLTESLLRKYNIAGLREGLLLCKGLCDQYWGAIHPPATEDDGHSATVAAFSALVAESTYRAILGTTIVQGQKQTEREPRRYTAQDFLRAKELDGTTNGDYSSEESAVVGLSEFKAIAELTPMEFHEANLATINECLQTLDALGDFFRENCLEDAYGETTWPNVAGMRTQLETVMRLIKEISGGRAGEASEPVELIDSGSGGAMQIHGQPAVRQEMNRETALRAIEDIAKFFERTEPHTPIHFALRKAVRWGRMPLPELLAELLEDGVSIDHVRKLIGLPLEQPGE